ncbi:E3 ubiquitin-protein ligase rnf13 [Physocladia obscura]|uniref:E3 ubiquitin-protein ligase rnf13 n=1 Tax=Physocladia obscura TaxID=109957 RepID=A0AAD5T0L2_9FUNG|nr:E3 ubiquitin-protein ligase rnf13 [Physocladia obscura]
MNFAKAILMAQLVQAGTLLYAHGRLEVHSIIMDQSIFAGFAGLLVPLSLVSAGDTSGCFPVKMNNSVLNIHVSNARQNQPHEWIALVDGIGCSALQKIDAMHDSGAIGVIMSSNSDGGTEPYLTGSTTIKTLTIPAVSISRSDYNVFMNDAAKLWSVSESIFRVRVLPDPSLPFLLLIILWPFLVIALYELNSKLQQYWAKLSAETVLRTLPIKSWDFKIASLAENSMCCICIEDYLIGDSVRYLPCGHDFHSSCVDRLSSYRLVVGTEFLNCILQRVWQSFEDIASDTDTQFDENTQFEEIAQDLAATIALISISISHGLVFSESVAELEDSLVPVTEEMSHSTIFSESNDFQHLKQRFRFSSMRREEEDEDEAVPQDI